jgi:hypothetical protein
MTPKGAIPRTDMKYLIPITILVLLTSCAVFDSYQTKAAEDIAKGIATYCAATIQSEREVLREKVNALAAPSSIVITCG